MNTLTFIYLILASPVRDGSVWVITPVPFMAVCQQVLADVRSHTGSWSDDFPEAPSRSYCLKYQRFKNAVQLPEASVKDYRLSGCNFSIFNS